MSEAEERIKRRYIRFKPDPTDYAQIAADTEVGFEPNKVALIMEEAPMGGCSLIMLEASSFRVDEVYKVKLGRMDPVAAKVRWVQDVGDTVSKVGFEFLE